MGLRYTLRYLGVPMKSNFYMFGDIRSVDTSATLPHSTLSKRHNILAFHRVMEAIAAKLIIFHWIQSEYYLSEMLYKHWEHFQMIQNCPSPVVASLRSQGQQLRKHPSHPNISTPHSRFPSSTQKNTYSYILCF